MKTNHTFISSNFNTIIKVSFLSIFLVILFTKNISAQCKPTIKIDGDVTAVDANNEFGLTLPYWLKENQTLAVDLNVSKISVLEFSVVNGNALEFSQVVNVTSTSPVSVPVGTVWKIESVAKENNAPTYREVTFSVTGTHTWTVPACVNEICIDMWGAGGGGGGGRISYGTIYGGGGGGGGAFGTQCFAVTPNTTYTITVGEGGDGGSSNVNGTAGTESKVVDPSSATIISAGGGSGGIAATSGTGGSGGTSTASINMSGATGANGVNATDGSGGNGGSGANGAEGGEGTNSGSVGKSGKSPAGGGGGGGTGSGGAGGNGKVIISW